MKPWPQVTQQENIRSSAGPGALLAGAYCCIVRDGLVQSFARSFVQRWQLCSCGTALCAAKEPEQSEQHEMSEQLL